MGVNNGSNPERPRSECKKLVRGYGKRNRVPMSAMSLSTAVELDISTGSHSRHVDVEAFSCLTQRADQHVDLHLL